MRMNKVNKYSLMYAKNCILNIILLANIELEVNSIVKTMKVSSRYTFIYILY
jgi:hypothetical protein